MEVSSILVLGVIGVASFIAALSILIIKELMIDGSTAMVKMKLNQEETVNEFKQLLIFHSLVIPAMIFVTAAGITEQKIYIDLGRALVGIQGIGVTAVFYKWWRRF